VRFTIYILATDDDCGTHASVFGSEAARDDALLEWVGSNREEWAQGQFSDDLNEHVQSKTDYLDTFSTDEQEVDIDPAQLLTVNEAWKICKDNPGSFGNLYDPDEVMITLDGWAVEGDEEDRSHWFDPESTEDRMAILAWCEAEGPDFEDRVSDLVCTNLPNRGQAFTAHKAKHAREQAA